MGGLDKEQNLLSELLIKYSEYEYEHCFNYK